MKALTFIFVLCLASAAAANTGLPPPKYDHAYHGKLTVIHLNIDDARKICGPYTMACAFPGKGHCTIILGDKGYDNWITQSIKRHEIGHCNGWPPDHSK